MKNHLREKRLSLGLTQAQLAGKAKTTLRSYRRYEADITNKEHRLPDAVTAIRIADALGVKDLRELWGGKANPA